MSTPGPIPRGSGRRRIGYALLTVTIASCVTLMALLDQRGPALAPETLRALRDAALADEHGTQLQAALARLDAQPVAELAVA